MSNTIGKLFRVTTFGESHGAAVGCVVDGCPAGLELAPADVQRELDRRRPGGPLVSARAERDEANILSGIWQGRTLGTPIAMLVWNKDQRDADYDSLVGVLRPSHADFTVLAKYGWCDPRGGGRTSARETVGRVAGGAVAGKLLREWAGITVTAYVSAVGPIRADIAPELAVAEDVDRSPVRCPDPDAGPKMAALIEEVTAAGDSVGGVVECVVTGVPAGLGEPVFDKLNADLAKAMASIPASRGFEQGLGFAATGMTGSAHNDAFVMKAGRVGTVTNRSGGIQGGISNGEPIIFRVPFKPTPSIARPQPTLTAQGAETIVSIRGRHDPCVAIRAVAVVEAMARLVLADHLLRQNALRPWRESPSRSEETP